VPSDDDVDGADGPARPGEIPLRGFERLRKVAACTRRSGERRVASAGRGRDELESDVAPEGVGGREVVVVDVG
jgi:hypothetical protein